MYDFLDPTKRRVPSPHWNTIEELARVQDPGTLDLILGMLQQPDSIPLMAYGKKEVAIIPLNKFSNPNDWYVIGDLHSDFYAFSNQLHWIKTNNPNFKLIFLGDLIDRGPHPIEVITLMLQTIHDYPDRVLWIAGNHDEAITLQENDVFWASVSPAEFTDLLNRKDDLAELRKTFGKAFIEIAKRLPRAAVFPDGLLVTHGGFPLSDLQAKLLLTATPGTPPEQPPEIIPEVVSELPPKLQPTTSEQHMGWLNSPEALQDFTWTRITDWPKKIPNRTTKGCSYGFKDFASFCEATKDFFGFPIQRLLTGHEHPAEGFDKHVPWVDHTALTLKGFGFSGNYEQPQAYATKYDKNLVIGRLQLNQTPEVIQIPVIEKDLYSFFSNAIMKLPEFANIEQKIDTPLPSANT
jgi:hypothetical protein